jgi:hypothetical protein
MSSVFNTEEKFDKEVVLLEGKTFHIRKWKVKDRKAFKAMIQETKGEISPQLLASILVFPCILEKNILLTEEEIKYVITLIREISISDEFTFKFYCDNEECEEENEVKIKLKEINKFSQTKWSTVNISETETITFGERVNAQFYYNVIFDCKTPEEKIIADLATHIIKFNDDDTKSYNETLEIIENLDIDIQDKILDEYNKQKFTQNAIYEVQCKKCERKQTFLFDEIPDFLPKSWII